MVREYKYFVADAYTDLSFVGNPSGVILTEGKMSDEEMLKAARELKHSETTCVRRLDKDIYHVRYFSPVKEVSLSGHAALAAFWTLAERGYIDGREEIRRVRQYTQAGALYVDFNFANEEIRFVDVQLPKMEIALEAEAVASVAAAFKLKEKDIGGEKGLKPAVIDAGIKTMVIPLTSPDALRDMEPKRRRMGELTEKYGAQCFHLFYYDGANRVVQRNFSPAVGIWEESGTGTGSGAMYFYLKEKGLLREENIICCQGEEMGRPSEIVLREKDGSIYAGG
ncbi:MAG: PhzF family phenazine biosynthesis protein [Aedoeadaptatus pacaensis]